MGAAKLELGADDALGLALTMVADSLTSSDWYRIAGLHPRLRPHVSVRMQITRGQPWYVLFNQATGRHHRVNKQAYELVGRMDGNQSVNDIWQVLLGQLKDDVPSQHDVIRVIGQMTDAGLIQAEVTPDVGHLVGLYQQRSEREKRSRINPMLFRLGLFNPSLMLEKLAPVGRWLWTPWVQWPALLLMVVVAWTMLLHTREIGAYAHGFFMTPTYLTLAWVVYPLMKALHELGHALALRRYGCEVPEVGVHFFLLVPMPYVDASASNQLVNRWQRAHISGAGIWVELMLAAVAGCVWLTVEDGWVRQLAFVVCSIGVVSSLLFNGNPLMRMDGYYVLCDVLDLPNLAGRSNKLLARLLKKLAFVLVNVPMPAQEPGVAAADMLERWAMALYAPATLAYRILLAGWLIVWAADRAFWLGVLVVSWSVWSLFVKPIWSWLASIQTVTATAWARARVSVLAGIFGLCLWALMVGLKVPSSMVVEGVVWLPENAQVRASVDGYVETLWVRGQQPVAKDDALVTIQAPEKFAGKQVLQAQIEQHEAEFHSAFGVDSLRMKNAQEALERDKEDLRKLEQDLAAQTLRAGTSGIFVLYRPTDLEGHEVNKGDVIGYVMGQQHSIIRALVPQSQIDEIRLRLKSVTVMLDEKPGQVIPAHWVGEVPAASNLLPSDALADRMGGRVATQVSNQDRPTPLEPTFVVDVSVAQALPRTGGLARIKLHLEPQSLGQIWGKRLRQLLLRHFSTNGT